MKQYLVCILKKSFYDKYPSNIFPEILQKGENRPYLVLLIKINNKLYALPFRSNINHKYCFKIKNNRGLKEGIDYTKALVIKNSDIDRTAHLRPSTIPKVDKYINVIIRDFKKFLLMYQKIKNGEKNGKNEQYILSMTTLKYFE